jgi:hypothetical protein
VEDYLLQGLGEDDVELTATVDEGLREQGTLDYWLDNEGQGGGG